MAEEMLSYTAFAMHDVVMTLRTSQAERTAGRTDNFTLFAPDLVNLVKLSLEIGR